MTTQNKWYISYDILRIIAIIGVICIHTGASFIITYDTHTIEFFSANILAGLCYFAVPVFLMISGALLLNENKPFEDRKFIRGSWFKLVLITIFWVIFYGLFYGYGLPILTYQPTSLHTFLYYLVNVQSAGVPHLWFMYMIIGIYLFVPILRLFVKKENKKYIFWLIIGAFLVQCIPKTLSFLTATADFTILDFVDQFYLTPLTGFIFYFLLGWYLTNFDLSKNKRRILYISGITATIIGIWVVQTFLTQNPAVFDSFYGPQNICGALWGIAVFVFITTLFKDKENNHPRIKELSRFVFGIYIIHALFLVLFITFIPYSTFALQIPIIYLLTVVVVVFVLSYAVVFLVSRIKYVKNIFYLK